MLASWLFCHVTGAAEHLLFSAVCVHCISKRPLIVHTLHRLFIILKVLQKYGIYLGTTNVSVNHHACRLPELNCKTQCSFRSKIILMRRVQGFSECDAYLQACSFASIFAEHCLNLSVLPWDSFFLSISTNPAWATHVFKLNSSCFSITVHFFLIYKKKGRERKTNHLVSVLL